MSSDIHRQAEELTLRAAKAAAEERTLDAQAAYGQAAELEELALASTPPQRVRTRGALSISVVSLRRRSGDLERAAQTAYRFLSEQQPSWVSHELESELDEIRSQTQAQRFGVQLTPHVFEWSLKGPAIFTGEGPIGIVLAKIEQVMRYGTRVGEFVSGLPLRRTGPPPRTVRELMGMTSSEPASGSFRFRVRLFREPAQTTMELEGNAPPSPDTIAVTYQRILQAATRPETSELEALVPQSEYALAFLQLVRALAPDGRQITWIDVTRTGSSSKGTRLSAETAQGIRERLKGVAGAGREEVVDGVLRALDLNHGWIELGERPSVVRCYVDESSPVLEDVVGPLVNRRVTVHVFQRGSRVMIRDIEPESEPAES